MPADRPSVIAVPFRTAGFEWLAVMEVMGLLGALALVLGAGVLWAAFRESRAHPRPPRRDMWLLAVASAIITAVFFWPPNFFYAPFAIAAALAPGLTACLARARPAGAGLIAAVLATSLSVGRLAGWWEQCHCPLAFLVSDPAGGFVLRFVPTMSIAVMDLMAGLAARRLFPRPRRP